MNVKMIIINKIMNAYKLEQSKIVKIIKKMFVMLVQMVLLYKIMFAIFQFLIVINMVQKDVLNAKLYSQIKISIVIKKLKIAKINWENYVPCVLMIFNLKKMNVQKKPQIVKYKEQIINVKNALMDLNYLLMDNV